MNQFVEYINKHRSKNIKYIDEIDYDLLEAFRAFHLERVAKKTVKNLISTVSTMFNHAEKLGYIKENPCKKLDKIRGIKRNKERVLSKDEIVIILDVVKNSYLENFVLFALYTGMRRNELINLKYEDINVNDELIYVRNRDDFLTKSRKERVMPIHNKLILFLKNKTKRIGYCFSLNDNKLNPHTVTDKFKKLIKKTELPDVTIHTLRHTFISHCLMSGISIWEVGQWVGHSSSHMTELYGHLCPKRKEIDKLEIV